MPFPYILVHLLACLICFYALQRSRMRPAWLNASGILVLVVVFAGFLFEREAAWAWRVMPYTGTDLVFLTNLTLEGVAVLFALMWRTALTKREQWRALLFCLPLLCVSLWSYAWYFEPLPPGMNGRVDRSGFCRQSSDDSCSAAAATMLLYYHGVSANEAEMARLCLTRAGIGTSPLGLFRGLAIKAAPQGLQPKLVQFKQPEQLRLLKRPAIINVGLKANLSPAMTAKMEGYGWSVGSRHSVVVLGADRTGKWINVADPSYGREHWPTADLNYLWDGSALVLDKR